MNFINVGYVDCITPTGTQPPNAPILDDELPELSEKRKRNVEFYQHAFVVVESDTMRAVHVDKCNHTF